MTRQDRMEKILSKKFSPVFLEIQDESHQHAGHAGAGESTHFFLTVVSGLFEGKTLLERHRAVQKELESEFSQGLHALRLKTFSPQEWEKKVK